MQLVSCPDEGKYIRTPPPRFTLHGMHLGIPQAVIFSWGTPAVLYGMHKEPSALERLAMQDTKAISQTCRDQRHLRMYAVLTVVGCGCTCPRLGARPVMAWRGWTKDFGDEERAVRLSFSRCKMNPEHTLVVHIELEGRVYNDMKDELNVAFPSLKDVGPREASVGREPRRTTLSPFLPGQQSTHSSSSRFTAAGPSRVSSQDQRVHLKALFDQMIESRRR